MALVRRSFQEKNKGKAFIDVMDAFCGTEWVSRGLRDTLNNDWHIHRRIWRQGSVN